MTNRKLHTRFRLIPKSRTLGDLQGPLLTLFRNNVYFAAHHENLNEDRPILLVAKIYSPITLVFRNIKFVRIFAGFPGKEGIKKTVEWSKKQQFSVLSVVVPSELLDKANDQHYDMTPCQFLAI